MRIAVSLGKNFSNYSKLCELLNSIEFTELVALDNPDLERYKKEFNKSVQFFKIEWNNIKGSKNIKENKFGKPYDADAAASAAKNVVDYANSYVKLGDGDYSINKAAKEKGLEEITFKDVKIEKRYKF